MADPSRPCLGSCVAAVVAVDGLGTLVYGRLLW